MPKVSQSVRVPDISEIQKPVELAPQPSRFFCTIPSGFTYCIVPSDKVLIQGTLYRQKGKYAIFHPGKEFVTSDLETIEHLRDHPGYGAEILEMGVHVGK